MEAIVLAIIGVLRLLSEALGGLSKESPGAAAVVVIVVIGAVAGLPILIACHGKKKR